MSPTLSILQKQRMANPSDFAQLQGTASKLAAYYVWHQSLDESDAVKKAANVVLNDHFNQGSINSSPYLIPKTDFANKPINPQQAQAALKLQFEDAVNQNAVVPQNFMPGVNQDQREKQYQSQLAISGHWQNQGSTGYVLVDGQGKPVEFQGKKGSHVISVDNTELSDEQSPINLDVEKEIHNLIGKPKKSSSQNFGYLGNAIRDVFTDSRETQTSALSHIINRPVKVNGQIPEKKVPFDVSELTFANLFSNTHLPFIKDIGNLQKMLLEDKKK